MLSMATSSLDRNSLEYAVDYLNHGEEYAKDRYLPKHEAGRVNPTNGSFGN